MVNIMMFTNGGKEPKNKGFNREGGKEDDRNIQFNGNVRGIERLKTFTNKTRQKEADMKPFS